ncbi:hypothetical protein LCGC14_2048590 [marine sediment metagenome]|uniref:Recombination endonuclease VII n=1 Tax=marine sediment metagenome TaxID=412755 RepID=A0A0F9H353_9ZZZZ
MDRIRVKDETGKQYGRWEVIDRTYSDDRNATTRWNCKCSCGNERSVMAAELRRGRSRSCGCLMKEKMSVRLTKEFCSRGHKMSEIKGKQCTSCKKIYARVYGLRKYGLTLETFESLLASQDNVCAICKTDEWGKKGPAVDHDHVTGAVRGILCGRCNSGLGHFRDNTDFLTGAIKYLESGE